MVRRVVTLAQQQLALRQLFPDARCRIRRSQLTWEGRLLPAPLARDYEIKMTYKLEKVPRVSVLSPKIERRDGRLPKHLYEGEYLCLYDPKNGDWSRSMLLARTIIPWTSEWLANYEVWLASGIWYADQVSPI